MSYEETLDLKLAPSRLSKHIVLIEFKQLTPLSNNHATTSSRISEDPGQPMFSKVDLDMLDIFTTINALDPSLGIDC